MPAKEITLPEKPALPANATIAEIVTYEIASGRLDPQTAERMVKLRIEWEDNEAKKAFNRAFAHMKIPPIHKTKKGAQAAYAPYEEIKEITDPILEANGFGLTFTSGPADEKDRIPIIGTLLHELGHSREGTVHQPIGAVSRGMNANQAMASATTYGMRDCAKLMLNLAFIGADDDAQIFSSIDERQRLTLEKLIEECKMTPESTSKFLTVVGAKSIGDIMQRDYEAALNLLLKKRKQVLAKK